MGSLVNNPHILPMGSVTWRSIYMSYVPIRLHSGKAPCAKQIRGHDDAGDYIEATRKTQLLASRSEYTPAAYRGDNLNMRGRPYLLGIAFGETGVENYE